jgi:hypothetical protein
MMTDPAASGPGTHLEPDRLADLFEGLLDVGAAEAARAHLGSCALCSADFALIAGEAEGDLDALLATTPIPQDVVIRIEAALHREPPLSAPAPAAQHAAPRRRSRRFRLALGSLAGACLVIVGGIGAFSALNSGSGASNSYTSSSKQPEPALGSQSPGEAHAQDKTPGDSAPGAGAGADGTVPSPGTSKQQAAVNGAAIQQQALSLLEHPETASPGTGQLANFKCPPPDVQGTGLPLAGTTITYAGQPAELLVYAKPGSATVDSVYVVSLGPSCVQDQPGSVLYQTEITRP